MNAVHGGADGMPVWDGITTDFAFRYAPEVLEWETAEGWMRRACRANGQPSLPPVALQLGLNHRHLSSRSCLMIAANSRVAGLADLAANTASVSGGRLLVRGLEVPRRRWSTRYRRYCPACLHESAHHRLFWDFTFFLTCPLHGVPILGGAENGRVSWAPTDLAMDHEGRVLPAAAPRLAVPTPGIEAWFMGRVGALPPEGVPLLDPCESEEVVWAARALGAFLLGDDTYDCGGRLRHAAARQNVGFEALRGGREHLVEVLSERAAQAEAARPKRSESAVGHLFGWFATLARSREGPLARHLTDVMEGIVSRGGRRRMWGRNKAPPGVAEGMLTLTEFAAALGISTRSVRRIPILADVAPRGRGGSSRLYFSRDELEASRVAIDTALSAAEVRTVLGLRITDLPTLEAAGHVRCVPVRDPLKRAKAYLRADVEGLADWIGSFAETIRPSVGFERVATAMKVTTGELARRVVAGEIHPIGSSDRGRGFRSLRFDPAGAGVSPTQPGLSRTEAATRLGISLNTVRMLVREGQLAQVGERTWRGGICPASLDAMAKRCVSTERLAPAFGCHPRGVAGRLAALGIEFLSLGRDAIGLVDRSKVAALFEGTAAAPFEGAASEATLDTLPTVRRWKPPKSGAVPGEFSYVARSHRVSATLTFDAQAVLSVDCSSWKFERRYRIARLVEGRLAERLPGFRIERGATGDCHLIATLDLTARAGDGAQACCRWIEERLRDLADVFTLVDAEERLKSASRSRPFSEAGVNPNSNGDCCPPGSRVP